MALRNVVCPDNWSPSATKEVIDAAWETFGKWRRINLAVEAHIWESLEGPRCYVYISVKEGRIVEFQVENGNGESDSARLVDCFVDNLAKRYGLRCEALERETESATRKKAW